MLRLETDCAIIDAHHSQHIANIIINNQARHNIMTRAAWEAIPPLMSKIAQLPDIRLVLIRGAGEKAFIAGADISEFDDAFSGPSGMGYDTATVNAFEAVSACPFPTIAAIRGYCIGGGLGLALACDIRLASDDSKFGIPAGRLGLAYPTQAIHRLSSIVGSATAKDIIFSAERFNEKLAQYCEQLCSNAPLSLQAAKFSIDQGPMGDLEAMYHFTLNCLSSEDYAEGRIAFKEKRVPTFKGK
jgi:enoyl-CoA hydratase